MIKFFQLIFTIIFVNSYAIKLQFHISNIEINKTYGYEYNQHPINSTDLFHTIATFFKTEVLPDIQDSIKAFDGWQDKHSTIDEFQAFMKHIYGIDQLQLCCIITDTAQSDYQFNRILKGENLPFALITLILKEQRNIFRISLINEIFGENNNTNLIKAKITQHIFWHMQQMLDSNNQTAFPTQLTTVDPEEVMNFMCQVHSELAKNKFTVIYHNHEMPVMTYLPSDLPKSATIEQIIQFKNAAYQQKQMQKQAANGIYMILMNFIQFQFLYVTYRLLTTLYNRINQLSPQFIKTTFYFFLGCWFYNCFIAPYIHHSWIYPYLPSL